MNQKAKYGKRDILRCISRGMSHQGPVVRVKTQPNDTALYKISPFGPHEYYWLSEEELVLVSKSTPETTAEVAQRLTEKAQAKLSRADDLEQAARACRAAATRLLEEARILAGALRS